MATSTLTTQETFANRLQDAHTALFKLIESHHHSLPRITYAEAGIMVQITPGASSKATIKLFCGVKGKFIPGLELVVPDVGTASYLLHDTIAAAKSDELASAIRGGTEMFAHIDKVDGYPTILEWLQD